MKKIIIAVLFCASCAGAAFAADTTPTEEDYKNLAELRTELVRMKREMDGFIKDITATYPDNGKGGMDIFGQDVKVDVTENDKEVLVRADLPGMEKDKIDVSLENNKFLKIAGTREVFKEETSQGVVKQERSSGRFERVLELPSECLSEGIKATYKNGVLDLVIPKKAKAKEDTVKIKIQ